MFAIAIHFHRSLILADKARAYQSGAPILICKYQTIAEVNCSGKRSSLTRYGNNYDHKIT
jgi:hypothetical protein